MQMLQKTQTMMIVDDEPLDVILVHLTDCSPRVNLEFEVLPPFQAVTMQN